MNVRKLVGSLVVRLCNNTGFKGTSAVRCTPFCKLGGHRSLFTTNLWHLRCTISHQQSVDGPSQPFRNTGNKIEMNSEWKEKEDNGIAGVQYRHVNETPAPIREKIASKKQKRKVRWETKENIRVTGSDIVDKVAWSLYSEKSDDMNRWKTKQELTSYLQRVRDHMDQRSDPNKTASLRNMKSYSAPEDFFPRLQRPKHKMHERSGHCGNSVLKKNMKITKEVECCVETLSRGKERANIFNDGKLSDNEDSSLNYKMAVDWFDEWTAENVRVTHVRAPVNHYMEMLEWSSQGRLPSFPISNEDAWTEEIDVPFHKHIFIDKLLDNGFPKHGPVRKFMEAVAVGLSQNPFLTYKEKEEHVDWFREYFDEKRETLKTLGAIGDDDMMTECKA